MVNVISSFVRLLRRYLNCKKEDNYMICTFEEGKQWFGEVSRNGEIIHRTRGFDTKKAANMAAVREIKEKLRMRDNVRMLFDNMCPISEL